MMSNEMQRIRDFKSLLEQLIIPEVLNDFNYKVRFKEVVFEMNCLNIIFIIFNEGEINIRINFSYIIDLDELKLSDRKVIEYNKEYITREIELLILERYKD